MLAFLLLTAQGAQAICHYGFQCGCNSCQDARGCIEGWCNVIGKELLNFRCDMMTREAHVRFTHRCGKCSMYVNMCSECGSCESYISCRREECLEKGGIFAGGDVCQEIPQGVQAEVTCDVPTENLQTREGLPVNATLMTISSHGKTMAVSMMASVLALAAAF